MAAAGIEVYRDGKSIIKSIAYLKDLKRNYEKLKQEAEELRATKDVIHTEISRFRLTPVMKGWIARTGMIEGEVRELETKYNNEKKRGCRLDRLANLSRDMAKKCNQKAKLVMELPVPVRKILTLKLQDNSSLHKAVQHVLRFLEDEQIRRMGICGMVGTGKTTIMQNLNNHEKVAKCSIWLSEYQKN
ncbi:hypothetical protein AAG906_007675 [Vitis piasezkii]